MIRVCPITAAKFVGTVSLGLLTGVSYTLSTLTLPSLLFLPTAPSAAQTHAYLKSKAKRTQRILSAVAITTLCTAFALSSPRRRHPYLLWTSIVCAAGFVPGVNRFVRNGVSQEEEVDIKGMEESGVIVGSNGSSESGEEQETVNGEIVRRGVERGRKVEAVRTGIWGLAFLLGVVGIWGEGA
ncbi:hypothetical protein FKW77_000890 [Venturia effusa]|uniref:Autophagy-related protein 33 n=1 Tax=Venturia effusa TaxID=50376 RepID=A0A517LGG3_9PEZI|nr:hypothetical protein FKW77_000890 [Venturia effusa]